jgi:hypothetical protein
MPKAKFDGVVVAVHYTPGGMIDWVRAHERRDMVFSDVLILNRDDFLKRLQDGERFVTGKRKKYLGNSFETGLKIITTRQGDETLILTEGAGENRDLLVDVPIL